MSLWQNLKTRASGFRLFQSFGSTYMGPIPYGGGLLLRVTAVDTTTTVFGVEMLENFADTVGALSLDDMLNSGWKVRCIYSTQASNIGCERDITDFVIATGRVTTVAMPATYTVGDLIAILPNQYEEGTGGHIVTVDSNVAATTFGDASFSDYANDHFNDNYVAMIFKGAAITDGTIRVITDFVKTAGVFTVDTFGATTTLGDKIYIFPRNLIMEGSSLPVRLGDIDTTVATGAIAGTKSMMAYIKQIVTLLLGTSPGAPIVIQSATTITPATAAVDLTGNAAGTVLIEEIAVQKITGVEANAVTSYILSSNDTVPLKLVLHKNNDPLDPLVAADMNAVGSRYSCRVNWVLSTTKKLQVATTGVNGTAGYIWTVKAKALTEGATLISA